LSLGCIAQVAQGDLTQYYIDKLEPCGGAKEVLKIEGKWSKAQSGAFDKTFPVNQRKAFTTHVDSMLSCMKAAIPGLPGLEAGWYYWFYGKPGSDNEPYRYSLETQYFSYLCKPGKDKNEFVIGDETGTWAYMFVNNLNWLVKERGNLDIHDNGQKVSVYELSPKAGQWKGLTLYESITHGKGSHAVVLSHNGKLPWHTLTRKQYLAGLKNKLEEDKNKALADIDAQEAKMKQRPSAQLDVFEKYKPGNIVYANRTHDEGMKYINDYLKNASDDELQKPALFGTNNLLYAFKGHFDEESNGATTLVTITGKYFDESLPKYVPQFIVLYWTWSQEVPAQNFKKLFEENFPIEKLKAMIDK
jgi:hypothetical protein